MTEIIKNLRGYKTYYIAIAIGIVTGLKYAGIIDEQTYNFLFGLLTAGGAATIAAKINRTNQ